MAKLAENQQKIQSGLDTVTTTTGQTTRDIVALSDVQARSEQAAQTSRVELADKLAAMAQDQQSWLQRFDAAQARIQAMADGIATLDQQLGEAPGLAPEPAFRTQRPSWTPMASSVSSSRPRSPRMCRR